MQDAIERFSYDGAARKVTVNLNRDPNDGAPDYANASPGNPIVGADDFGTSVDIFYTRRRRLALATAHRLAGGADRLRSLLRARAATSTASTC